MKRPEYIEVGLPLTNKILPFEVRKYLRSLEGKEVFVKYTDREARRVYTYTILKAIPDQKYLGVDLKIARRQAVLMFNLAESEQD